MYTVIALALYQGFLISSFFWKIGQYNFDPLVHNEIDDQVVIIDYAGLVFLVCVDQFATVAFGQLLMIPNIYPVFTREISNNMYPASAFCSAMQVSSIIGFFMYPLTVGITSFWCLDFYEHTFWTFLNYMAVLSTIAWCGGMFGFMFGTMLKNYE